MITLYENAREYLDAREIFPEYLNDVSDTVRKIIQSVRANGDVALRSFSKKFDGATDDELRVPAAEIAKAVDSLTPEIRDILLEAADNVRQFHQKQLPESWLKTYPDGTKLGQKFTPIDAVGLYIPGGTAVYPSTVIMNVIPAQIAGVPRIAAISPPRSEGRINQMVLAVLGLLGVDEIYALGGAHGVAALAYGSETVPRVYKIAGPGNAYVMEAKRQVYGQVGIDSLAGPTEVVVIADGSANPAFVARDLMAQAEHDPHAMSILITTSTDLTEKVQQKLNEFVPKAERKEILEQALTGQGAAVLVADLAEAAEVANEIAPEHLEIMTRDDAAVEKMIRNAGAIFWGKYTSEPVGDYWAGPNHTLPTNGTARFSSPLGVMDYMKHSSLIHFSKDRLMRHADKIEKFAQLEGLYNHGKSVEERHDTSE